MSLDIICGAAEGDKLTIVEKNQHTEIYHAVQADELVEYELTLSTL
jgi:hypothetical protein